MKESEKTVHKPRINRPQWQTPPGLTPGNLDYIQSSSIASDYDDFLAGNCLHDVDGEVLSRYLPSPELDATQRKIVIDFGCGNGRTLLPLIQCGFDGFGVDLSPSMLHSCREKAIKLEIDPNLQLAICNLVQLDPIADQCADAGVCMFSTLGMIRGRSNRSTFLEHARRIIKPGGLFILHAHSALYQARQTGGLRWAATSLCRSINGSIEFGDRTANYRGVKDMFIHSFRRSELSRDLRRAGFESQEWIGIPPLSKDFDINAPLPWLDDFRLVGWTVVCKT